MNITIESLDFSNIHSSIEHLTKDEIVDVIQRYYQGETISEIKKEYKISNSINIPYVFPHKVLTDLCDYCSLPYKQEWQSRKGRIVKFPYCKNCKHKQQKKCSCKKCIVKRREKELFETQMKIELIRNTYDEKNFDKYPEKQLTLREKLFLATLLRAGLNEDLDYIKPLCSINIPLTPTHESTIDLIKTLSSKSIIVPHRDSDPSAFAEVENFPRRYFVQEVMFRLNIAPFDHDFQNMVQRLLYPSKEQFESNPDFCFEMWKKISLDESLEYLLYSMKKVGYDFNPGKKTINLFEYLLEYYSVSQIYSLIYRAVANSTKLYQEKKLPKQHAANTVITFCESHGERAIAEGWNLTKYRRNFDLPESVISKVFFTTILQIAYIGFDEKPSPV